MRSLPLSLTLAMALAPVAYAAPPGVPTPPTSPAPPSSPTQGHIVVRLAGGGEPLRVIVDGTDVGATPWEGDLPPGTHQIAGRSSTAAAAPQSIDVTAGSRTAVDLVASPIQAHLQVRTSDGKGAIFVDGAARGDGAFAGDVPPGTHSVVVARDGYERFEKTMSLAEQQTWAETVTLKPLAGGGATGSVGGAERAFEGIYGGFGLMGGFGVGGAGTELDTSCSTLGASSCDTPSPVGVGAFGYLGWTWNPVGFELFLVGLYDQHEETAHFTGAALALPASLPPRDEAFTFLRAGGGAAVRARASFQNAFARGTVAGGVGVSYRQLFMKRDATATDPSLGTEHYVPGSVSYISPAVSVEGAVQWRMSPTLSLALGLQLWADTAGSSTSVPPATGEVLVNRSTNQFTPIPTPGYHLASGPQAFLLPYLGMQFGP